MNTLFFYPVLILALSISGLSLSTTRPLASNGQDPDSYELARRAMPSIVSITGKDANGQPTTPGAGFFVGSRMVATDYRLIKDAVEIQMSVDGQSSETVTVVGVDSEFTVALLLVSGIKGTPLLRGITKAKPGSEVFGFANNGGHAGSEMKTTVSELVTLDGKYYLKLSSQEAELRTGSPILDQFGEVIAIVASRPNDGGGFGYAIQAMHLAELGFLPVRTRDKESSPIVGRLKTAVASDIAPGDIPGGVPVTSPQREAHSSESPKIVRKAGGVLQGSAIRRAQPMYPPLARAARVSGSVIVEVVVDTEGDVVSARAVSGHPLLKDSSVAAARGWKFTPTLLSGAPVKVIGTVTFNFSL